MFGEEQIGVFRKTLRQLIKELEEIQEVAIVDFQGSVEDAFDGYNYDGVEDIVGFDSWEDISQDGKYELNVKIDHEDAYELTIYATTQDGKITVTNVL